MADEFLVVWFNDGNSIVTHHSTSAEAFRRAKVLFQRHGEDIEVEIHLNKTGSILLDRQKIHKWRLAGYPPIQVSN
jgi:hypothetical protein